MQESSNISEPLNISKPLNISELRDGFEFKIQGELSQSDNRALNCEQLFAKSINRSGVENVFKIENIFKIIKKAEQIKNSEKAMIIINENKDFQDLNLEDLIKSCDCDVLTIEEYQIMKQLNLLDNLFREEECWEGNCN